MVEAVTVRRDRIVPPKFFVLKILTFKFFDIKILPTCFVEPAPSKTFQGYVGRGVLGFKRTKAQTLPFRERSRKLYFSKKSTSYPKRITRSKSSRNSSDFQVKATRSEAVSFVKRFTTARKHLLGTRC
jgi:hypothetical protein